MIRLLVYGADAALPQQITRLLGPSDGFQLDIAEAELRDFVPDRLGSWSWDAVLICEDRDCQAEDLELLRQHIGFCPIVVVGPCVERPLPRGVLALPIDELSAKTLQRLLQASQELRAARSNLACLEATARIKTDVLARQNEFVHSMTSRLCHEVRSPLTAARQFTTLLCRQQQDDSCSPPLADRVLRNLDDLSMLVDDLSGLSAWDVQHRSVRRVPCQPANLLQDIEPLLRDRARIEQVDFQMQLDDGLPDVFADPDAVGQAIRNLVVNSLQHAGADQQVRLRAVAAGDQVTMRIEDQFPTEDEAGMQEAFGEFCDLDITLDSSLSGRRRGLAVARRLLEMNLSQLQLQSLGSEGSGFTFQLPCAAPAQLIGHYLRHVGQTRPRTSLSLMTFETHELGDFLPGPAIDEFLQTANSVDDLVIQTSPLSWTALLYGNKHELNGRLRLLDALWASRRQRDSWLQLPALKWQVEDNWMLESNEAVIAEAFLRACGVDHEPGERLKRVLLVENHPERILRLSHQLEAAGYDVVVARDGKEGVSHASQRRPDAIVLDAASPSVDGVATLEQLRRIDDGKDAAPIIMLAANMRQQQQALDHGAKAIFDGSCHTNKVVQAVQHSLSDGQRSKSSTRGGESNVTGPVPVG